MTQEEKKIKAYVNAIERRLRLPLNMKQRINMDLGTDIHARLEFGKSVDEIMEEMGKPREIAKRLNAEMAEFTLPKRTGLSRLFLIFLILTVVYSVFTAAGWFLNQQDAVRIIGGADGPTSVFIAGKIEPTWQKIFFMAESILGLLSAYFLAYYGNEASTKIYQRCIVLSLAGIGAGIVGLIVMSKTGAMGIAQWVFKIPYWFTLTFSPEFILAIVTLIISIRWWQRARRLEENERSSH